MALPVSRKKLNAKILFSSSFKKGKISVSQVTKEVSRNIESISKITANRDLERLIKLEFIRREGRARAAAYRLSEHFRLIREI